MSAYYNEYDPYAAKWLENLIFEGLIADGHVDTRSIVEVSPSDLAGFDQCHFFAGIGGWSLAARLAGWPDDRELWTGSCPCQPFSAAGKGAGFADERHLWPAWQHLIAQCRPSVVFGEQVASKAVDEWIDLVHADMEGMGYAFAGVAFPAAGVGAPHIRDRTYWVADSDDARLEGRGALLERAAQCAAWAGGMAGRMADVHGGQRDGVAVMRGDERDGAHAGWPQGFGSAAARSDVDGVADADRSGSQSGRLAASTAGHWHPAESARGDDRNRSAGPTNGFWRDADWLCCTDGKWRPVEPGTFPLAHGIPARVGRLRAYGNAIVPQVAAEVIAAWMECAP